MPVEVRAVDALRAEIKSVDSKVNLLAEKIKRLETQNVTIANSLFKLTERLKKIEESGGGISSARVDAEQSQDLTSLRESLEKSMKENEAIKNDLYNVKYTLGLINPLEFVTVRQVNELVEELVEKKTEAMKKKTSSSKKKDEED
ncbi:MAG: hypothetical protein V1644_02470 [Candidatus Micrarchaeota archaeon]